MVASLCKYNPPEADCRYMRLDGTCRNEKIPADEKES